MITDSDGTVPLRLFPSFSALPSVRHFVSCRRGGGSAPPYDSLNLGFRTGDNPERVAGNRRILARRIGADPADFVFGRQVHGVRIAAVGAADRGRGALSPETALPDADGLATDEPGVWLAVLVADCVPVLLADPRRGAVAAVHAGRLGTLGRIAARAVALMAERFGSDPADIRAGVGPSIGLCCYPVGSPAAAGDAGSGLDSDTAAEVREGVVHLDLPETNRRQLVRAGLRPGRIELSGLCTSCSRDLFFSHRASGGTTGRFAAGIMVAAGRGPADRGGTP